MFSIHPQDTTVYLDDDATTVTVNLSCAANGSPLPVISWLKNNSKVDDDAVIRSQNISILTVVINEGTEKHLRYRCVATNLLGNISSQEATLMIAKRNEERLPMEGELTAQIHKSDIGPWRKVTEKIKFPLF